MHASPTHFRRIVLGSALVACIGCAAPTPPPPPPTLHAPLSAIERRPLVPEDLTGKLPDDLRPTHYQLALTIDPEAQHFGGTVDIEVDLDRPRETLWLHGLVDVQEAEVRPAGAARLRADWERVSPTGLGALRLPAPVGPGHATLHLEFTGELSTLNKGIYTVTRNGKHYAFAQLQPIFARRAFPCFDEPRFKTPFDVSLTVPKGMAAIANTHEISRRETSTGRERVSFARSEKLPTYLVTVAVGPFDVVAGPDVPKSALRARAIPIRGVATAGRGAELGYALANAPRIVSHIEAYLGTPYPFDKLDLIAAPQREGAMENAGAIVFDENVLLLLGSGAPESKKGLYYTVATHEIAHQWLGNLVTTQTWSDVWLNEGFATWMEWRAVSELVPELGLMSEELANVAGVMHADGRPSAPPLRRPIHDDSEIEAAFDWVPYFKGGRVLTMFERWVGPKAFQRGVREYLEAHRFGSVTSEDFARSLGQAVHRDLGPALRSFVDQPGMPFIEASLECPSHAAPLVRLKQSRYVPRGTSIAAVPPYQVPVCVKLGLGGSSETGEKCTLLAAPEGVLPLDEGPCPSFIHPNAGGAGYYWWSLDPAGMERLALGATRLEGAERDSLVLSLQASLWRGTADPGAIIDTLFRLARDPNLEVAGTALDVLEDIGATFAGDPIEQEMLRRIVDTYRPLLSERELSTVNESPSDRDYFVRKVVKMLVRDPATRAHFAAIARKELTKSGARSGTAIDARKIPTTFRPALLAAAIDEGNRALFDALLTEVLPDQRKRSWALEVLGYVTLEDLAEKARDRSLAAKVDADQVLTVLRQELARTETRERAWEWLKVHLDEVLAQLGEGWKAWSPWLGASFCDYGHLRELAALFEPRMATNKGGLATLDQAKERITQCIARRDAYEPSLQGYFGQRRGQKR